MKTISNAAMLTTPEYRQLIEDLKARVTAARISAARAVNRDLILLYWDIGLYGGGSSTAEGQVLQSHIS